MKHTITINNKNTSEHIIHLDVEKVPLTIKPLPHNTAYQLQNTPILTTTTKTLNKQTIQQIRQKNKPILQKTILIIIKNTTKTPKTKIETIQENPMISIHTTTQEKLPTTLKQIIQTNTPPTTKPITIQDNKNQTYTLQHDNKPIKTYHNKKYTTLIQKTLQQNPNQTLQEAEYQAQRQYYKHISYDKTNKTYKITLNKKTKSIHKKLQHAIQERNLQLTRQETDEETLCQNQNTNNTEPLPPTPWNNTITQTKKEHNKYKTKNKTKNTTHNNPDTITHINQEKIQHDKILNIQKPDRNITRIKNTYIIVKTKNKQITTYHTTQDKNEARYIRDKLEQNNYNKTQIPQYKQQYQYDKKEYQQTYNKKYDIIDYYTNTKTQLTTKNDIKDKYQQRQIQQNTLTPKTTKHPNTRTPEHQKK